MQGALGIGANLNKWTEQDSALATKIIAAYKRIRATVQTGDLYRLMSPRAGDVTANQYVSADGKQAVLFAFRHSQQYNLPAPAIVLRGLDPRAVYRLESIAGGPAAGEVSGAYLMSRGVTLNLRSDYDSAGVILERVQ
jgi:alpha-galactosidase